MNQDVVCLTIFYEDDTYETLMVNRDSPAFNTLESWAVTNGYEIAIVQVVA
jgi:hypothetical protein